MRSPTDVLRDEHRAILEMLTALERAAARLETGGALPAGWWERALAWLRAFADARHHAKEERALFPALVKAGVPAEHGPIAIMLAEHAEGRALIQAMAGAEPGRRAPRMRDYARLLRDHIAKEDGVLFPLADAVLDAPAVAGLAREFEAVELEGGRDAALEVAAAGARALGAVLDA